MHRLAWLMAKPRRMQLMSGSGMEGRFFHVLSRINGRARVLGDHEREAFRSLLRRAEKFSGVEVITWAMLSNHFHIVVHIPEKPPEITDEVFRERLKALYSREEIDEIRATMQRITEMTPGVAGEVLLRRYRQRFLDRMGDLSEFMKTLLQRFTQWFNKRHDRVGRLWESRFRSVLVEGAWEPLMRVAAYVDLNAVRAGMVEDPKDYRWSGYGEATAGKQVARRGLGFLLRRDSAAAAAEEGGSAVITWREVGREYRKLLFGMGEERGVRADGKGPLRRGLKRQDVEKVWKAGGRLTKAQLLRCRLRYFTDGVVIGSKEFVNAFFESQREYFSETRKEGARRMRGGDWGTLRCARDLQKAPVAL